MIQKFEQCFNDLQKNKEKHDPKVLCQFLRRMGTLYKLNNNTDGKKNKIDVLNIWQEAYNICSSDYQTNICLGLYFFEVI